MATIDTTTVIQGQNSPPKTDIPIPKLPSSPRKKNRSRNYNFDRASLTRRESPPKPTSRRYQRWLNNNTLLSAVSTDELEEEEQLYDCTRSPFRELFEREDVWEFWSSSLLETTDDLQEEILNEMFQFDNPDGYQDKEEKVFCADKKFQCLCKECKHLLRKLHGSKFLTELDQELYNFSLTKGHNFPLPMLLENGQQRLICHATCKFYSLHSQSSNINGTRVTIVRKVRDCPTPSVTLSQYLQTGS